MIRISSSRTAASRHLMSIRWPDSPEGHGAVLRQTEEIRYETWALSPPSASRYPGRLRCQPDHPRITVEVTEEIVLQSRLETDMCTDSGRVRPGRDMARTATATDAAHQAQSRHIGRSGADPRDNTTSKIERPGKAKGVALGVPVDRIGHDESFVYANLRSRLEGVPVPAGTPSTHGCISSSSHTTSCRRSTSRAVRALRSLWSGMEVLPRRAPLLDARASDRVAE